jgi:YhcH/YjgK/YiaL family protein
MVLDYLENSDNYKGLSPLISQGLAYLKSLDLTKLEPGKIELPNGIFAITQVFTPKNRDQGKLETHQKYLDIQFLAEGEEIIEYLERKHLVVSEPYSNENDIVFYHDNDKVADLKLKANQFVIFYPQDGHKPGIGFNKSQIIKKIVLKIPLK